MVPPSVRVANREPCVRERFSMWKRFAILAILWALPATGQTTRAAAPLVVLASGSSRLAERASTSLPCETTAQTGRVSWATTMRKSSRSHRTLRPLSSWRVWSDPSLAHRRRRDEERGGDPHRSLINIRNRPLGPRPGQPPHPSVNESRPTPGKSRAGSCKSAGGSASQAKSGKFSLRLEPGSTLKLKGPLIQSSSGRI